MVIANLNNVFKSILVSKYYKLTFINDMFVQNWLVIILIKWIRYNIIDTDRYQVGNWIKIKNEIRITFDTLHNALKVM